MMLLVGTSLLVQRLLMGFFWTNLFEMGRNIRTGDFDFFLAQPGHPLFMASTRKLDPDGLLNSLVAIGVVVYAARHLHLHPGLLDLALYGGLVLAGLAIHYSILVLTMSPHLLAEERPGDRGQLFHPRGILAACPGRPFAGWPASSSSGSCPSSIVEQRSRPLLLTASRRGWTLWLLALAAIWFVLAVGGLQPRPAPLCQRLLVRPGLRSPAPPFLPSRIRGRAPTPSAGRAAAASAPLLRPARAAAAGRHASIVPAGPPRRDGKQPAARVSGGRRPPADPHRAALRPLSGGSRGRPDDPAGRADARGLPRAAGPGGRPGRLPAPRGERGGRAADARRRRPSRMPSRRWSGRSTSTATWRPPAARSSGSTAMSPRAWPRSRTRKTPRAACRSASSPRTATTPCATRSWRSRAPTMPAPSKSRVSPRAAARAGPRHLEEAGRRGGRPRRAGTRSGRSALTRPPPAPRRAPKWTGVCPAGPRRGRRRADPHAARRRCGSRWPRISGRPSNWPTTWRSFSGRPAAGAAARSCSFPSRSPDSRDMREAFAASSDRLTVLSRLRGLRGAWPSRPGRPAVRRHDPGRPPPARPRARGPGRAVRLTLDPRPAPALPRACSNSSRSSTTTPRPCARPRAATPCAGASSTSIR